MKKNTYGVGEDTVYFYAQSFLADWPEYVEWDFVGGCVEFAFGIGLVDACQLDEPYRRDHCANVNEKACKCKQWTNEFW